MAVFTTDSYPLEGPNNFPRLYGLRYVNACRLNTGNVMIGSAVTKLEIYGIAHGSPTGTISAHVWDTSDSTVTNFKETSSTTYLAQNIDTADPQLLTFIFPGTYAMDVNSAVGVYYTNGADESNSINMKWKGGEYIANNVQGTEYNSGVWEYEGGSGSGKQNPAVQITYADPAPASSGTLLPPPPAMVRL